MEFSRKEHGEAEVRPERTSVLARRPTPYRWAWMASVLLHALVFAAAFGASLSSGCGGRKEPEKPVVAKLVRLGTPREKHLLPRLPTAPPPPPASKQAPQVTPGKELSTPTPPQPPQPPKPQPEPKPTAKAQTPSATPTPPAQAAAPKSPEPKKSELDDILQRFAAADRVGKAEPLPGQPDGDPMGDAEEAAEGERYLALVQKRLRDHYVLPSTIPEAERIRLSAIVRIHIERSGRIARYELEKPSGNPQFDAALEAAVTKASPLPPPPEHLLRTFANGFPVRFRY